MRSRHPTGSDAPVANAAGHGRRRMDNNMGDCRGRYWCGPKSQSHQPAAQSRASLYQGVSGSVNGIRLIAGDHEFHDEENVETAERHMGLSSRRNRRYGFENEWRFGLCLNWIKKMMAIRAWSATSS